DALAAAGADLLDPRFERPTAVLVGEVPEPLDAFQALEWRSPHRIPPLRVGRKQAEEQLLVVGRPGLDVVFDRAADLFGRGGHRALLEARGRVASTAIVPPSRHRKRPSSGTAVRPGVERRARNGTAMSEVLLSLYQGVREPDGWLVFQRHLSR